MNIPPFVWALGFLLPGPSYFNHTELLIMDDTKELILALIEQAKSGEHTKFEQLRFFNEYIAGRITHSAIKKVVVDLEYSADNLFMSYCKAVRKHQADVNLLLAYKQLQHAILYYKEELKIVKDILEDYENYLWEGNFIKAIIFNERRDIWNQH